jgi:alkanesulfonate monooxygenase SsuD/methylene tetrahydromethanopterin reductase-like flavin-dependent oxidoreductase (luciferase family)
MGLYGVDPERTYLEMEESLRIVSHTWTHRELEWNSDLITIQAPEGYTLQVVPKPLQQPHPPLFMACTHRETLRLAAEWGVGALVLGFGGPKAMEDLHRYYREFVDQRTGDKLVSPGVTNDFFGALCPTIVMDDRDEAVITGLRGQRFFAEAISHYYGGGPIPSGVVEDGIDEREAIKQAEETFVAKLHEMEIPVDPAVPGNYNPDQAYGTAQDAIAHVEALREVGVDEVMCLIQMGTVTQDIAMETIRQWGETVIPYFRAQEGAELTGASAAAR